MALDSAASGLADAAGIVRTALDLPGARLENVVRCIAARGDHGTGEIDGVTSDRIAGIFTFEPWED